ncbi:MAG: histidine kinase N-terminal 7TM domain-containing protein [Clostridia bacterium]
MKNLRMGYIPIIVLLFSLTACGPVGDKATSLSMIYLSTAIISVLLLSCYICLVKKKEAMFILLFSLVSVINIGYFALSVSKTLNGALIANRIAYFGSVFLPVSMIIIISNVCKMNFKKHVYAIMFAFSTVIFLIAASPGFLDIYYKEVSIEFVNGVTMLTKVYGPLHFVYLIYLFVCFCFMIGIITYASVKKLITSNKHAAVLLVAVLVNIGVWLFEQLVDLDFEFLSISYITTELFLISLYLIIQDYGMLSQSPIASPDFQGEKIQKEAESLVENNLFYEKCSYILDNLSSLTPTERKIYDYYCMGKTTKEVMEILSIKETTLKYHNRNIYGKLGVSSRKQLMQYVNIMRKQNKG